MKQTVYDRQTGEASQHWPVDVQEILARGRGRYTTDPNQVEGDINNPKLSSAPSDEEIAELQLAEAEHELAEASAQLAEHNEAEAHRLRELGEMEAETGEPITPQVYPSHFLDEEQANYPTDWKYRRHAVSDYGQPHPSAKIKRRPSVATVYESDAEKRRNAAMQKARSAQEVIRSQQQQQGAAPAEGGRRAGAAKDSKVVSERKSQLEQKKQAAEQARQQRKDQRAQEREERKKAREEAKAAQEGQENEGT